jgi:hypothetical protein
MADDYAPKYSFTTDVNKATGLPQYFYTNLATQKRTELQDADTYNRLKSKFDTTTNQGFNDITKAQEQDAGFTADDTAQGMRARRMAAQQKTIGKAKGGKVSSVSKRGDGIAQRGKTKGRFI